MQKSPHEIMTKDMTRAMDIMSSDFRVIYPDETIRKAIELLNRNHTTDVPVTDRDGVFLGILSEKDILKTCHFLDMKNPKALDKLIRFRKKVITVRRKASIQKIRGLLISNSQRQIPVINNKGLLKGIISRRDLLRVIYLRSELLRKKSLKLKKLSKTKDAANMGKVSSNEL